MNEIHSAVFRFAHSGFYLLLIGLSASSASSCAEEWDFVMRSGDTLIGIADRYFVDPKRWPVVQLRNRVADPRRIPIGTRLKIPAELLRISPVAAEVLMVNGQVNRQSANVGEDKPLSAGDSLHAGDRVRVNAGSNLSLRFPDGSRLLILERSRFTLSRASRIDGTDMRRIQIDLTEGRIESSVTPVQGGADSFEIKTPPLRMAVRGTRFRAASDPLGGQALSEVISGRVLVSGTRSAVMLGAGFGSHAVTGQPPQVPQPLSAAPELLGPLTLYERVPLHFSWKPMPAATSYRVQVLDSSANIFLDGVFPDSAVRWADLPDGRYTLRVRGIGAARLEGLDAEHAFVLNARPEPPFAREPVSKAYGESTQFVWTEVAGTGNYHFQLAGDGAFTQLLADEPALADSRITRALAPGRYFWRVASVDSEGDHGPFGDALAFEQRPVPASPRAEVPEVGDDQLRFSWRSGEPGQRYLLQLSKTADFAEIVLEQTTEHAFIDVPRPPSGEYFMRVKAISADGFAGPFGATQKFTVPGGSGWWLLLFLLPMVL